MDKMDIGDQIKILERGVSEIISPESLREKLESSKKTRKPLVIKAGFDPTAPDIHLGHVVLLNKLRQFQDLGHKVYFLIGDFTAQIGDPTGQKKLRPKLSQQEIKKNAATYAAQVFKILDKKKTKVVFNSRWFNKMSAQQILELTVYSSVAQVLTRADFKERFEQKTEISILEFMYPLLQGYDSVYLKSDVELGGTDQKFNLLMGRQLQEYFKQPPQVVMMTPLLEGTDGIQKMSKSLGNYIGIKESPKDIFGKVMSIPDDSMLRYYELLTQEDLAKIRSMHPKDAKMYLAQLIVTQCCGENIAVAAKADFIKVFTQKQTPNDIVEYHFRDSERLSDIVLKLGLVVSGNELRRLIKEGAVSLEGDKVLSENYGLKPGVLKVGKRRFVKLIRTN
ncbi:MAG: tyrosine--tRNA ligase [Candidatus Omnitrophota bacterium]|nr:tyrosine--tRNA ligase [Candidatus Omnitrophota bacterium]